LSKRTVVEINLGAIKSNLSQIKKKIGPKVKILLPVKADAYGHGIIEVSKFVEANGLVDMLGVASFDEAVLLRRAKIKSPILILGLLSPHFKNFSKIIDYNLTLSLADSNYLQAINQMAFKKKKKVKVHLKIDTGMGRIGCQVEDALNLVQEIKRLKNIDLEGIFSHFPVADQSEEKFTLNQIKKFQGVIKALEKQGIKIPLKHLANSAGIINFPKSWLDMVRPGLASYGYYPSWPKRSNYDLKPAMTLKSHLIFVKRVKAGVGLSYGLKYTPQRDSNIATIPIGYGDGYSRFLSNKGKVLIKGKIYPVVGRVTMDQILINLKDDSYPLGEEVILFGSEKITAQTIAFWSKTIPYEVTCAISKRVPRVYSKSDSTNS